MRYKELIKQLKKNKCRCVRHGHSHDWWYSPNTDKCFPVPRSAKEVPKGTLASIKRDAGIQ